MPVRNSALFRAACVALLMLAGVSAHAAGDVARGKQLSYTCLGCHGIANYKNVYPTFSVPKLAGQHPEYLAAALKAYRSQERSHATMHAQAASLSDQDIEDIAVYFAGAPLKRLAVVTPSARTRPLPICGSALGRVAIEACVSPASSEVIAGGPPRNGTCTILMPAVLANSAIASSVAPPTASRKRSERRRLASSGAASRA